MAFKQIYNKKVSRFPVNKVLLLVITSVSVEGAGSLAKSVPLGPELAAVASLRDHHS